MARKDMRSALKGSMQQEEKAIEDRFAKADSVLPTAKPTVVKQPAEKVIRDSFTMPATDHELIGTLKQRSIKTGLGLTKSEIVRAGLIALSEMPENSFTLAIERVEKLKTGRPKQTI